MNENEEKLELIRAMTAVEIRPEQAEEELAARSYEKLPLSRLMALGRGLSRSLRLYRVCSAAARR